MKKCNLNVFRTIFDYWFKQFESDQDILGSYPTFTLLISVKFIQTEKFEEKKCIVNDLCTFGYKISKYLKPKKTKNLDIVY